MYFGVFGPKYEDWKVFMDDIKKKKDDTWQDSKEKMLNFRMLYERKQGSRFDEPGRKRGVLRLEGEEVRICFRSHE